MKQEQREKACTTEEPVCYLPLPDRADHFRHVLVLRDPPDLGQVAVPLLELLLVPESQQ